MRLPHQPGTSKPREHIRPYLDNNARRFYARRYLPHPKCIHGKVRHCCHPVLPKVFIRPRRFRIGTGPYHLPIEIGQRQEDKWQQCHNIEYVVSVSIGDARSRSVSTARSGGGYRRRFAGEMGGPRLGVVVGGVIIVSGGSTWCCCLDVHPLGFPHRAL